jgi:DNA-binding protein H-NS
VARDQGKQTRLQGELAHRYAASTPVRKKQPGQSSLTEDLAEKEEGDVDAEQEAEQEVEGEAPEVLAEPKKSLFELPRKDPIRPSLLGGGVEVDPSPAPATSGPSAKPSAPAPTPGKKSSTTRRG